MPFPFEVPFEQIESHIEGFIDAVFDSLRSEFLALPKGEGFVEYPTFEQGYEELKRATGGFRELTAETVVATVYRVPMTFIVLRTMLGFTPPEWAYVASQRAGFEIPQGAVRSMDRNIRMRPAQPLKRSSSLTDARIRALVATACSLLTEGAPNEIAGILHRLDKADTQQGIASIRSSVDLGVPYAMLLYERFLGRPFAAHRDSVSELVGDVLETTIETALTGAGVSFEKTKRAQRIPGFDQAPDFIVPDRFRPQAVIEAKLTEDDGTARDKVTRVQHLGSLSTRDLSPGEAPRFEVIACIAGRGFKVRREDMRKLLLATRGKVVTLQTLDKLIDHTRLADFRTR